MVDLQARPLKVAQITILKIFNLIDIVRYSFFDFSWSAPQVVTTSHSAQSYLAQPDQSLPP